MKVLVVCTANICRSPMAERLLQAAAADRDASAEVTSAGVRALVGRPADRGAVDAMARRGVDLSDHVARQADDHLVDTADLVVTMEAAHVVELVSSSRERFAKTFTLPELVDRSLRRRREPDEPLDAWLARVAEGRSAAALLGAGDLDVVDPYGGPSSGFRRCSTELDELCTSLGRAMWGA